MKYNPGDRVEIINYGHQVWSYPDGKNGSAVVTDIAPRLVGKHAVVVICSESQPGWERYSLDIDDYGSRAWFGLNQLKDEQAKDKRTWIQVLRRFTRWLHESYGHQRVPTP